MSAAATTTVFNTTELLELILLSLDPRTLLTAAARVNRRFHDTLRASLPLRRALFRLGRYDEPDADHDGGYMPMVAMKALEEMSEGWKRQEEERRRQRRIKAAAAAAVSEEGEGDGNSVIDGAAATPTWRRMLISQPPPRRVEVVIYGTSMFQSVKAWVECEEGVTLGLLYDKCQELSYGRSWSRRAVGWFFEL
ncbi:hypothetical protein SLS58_010524 [Diplodia intermedia]|uniref:F-box domain-containing protein n=1 Tax=Diplodia intermedia TaxID=856260 RepID=A0ABR3T670_9PEZI